MLLVITGCAVWAAWRVYVNFESDTFFPRVRTGQVGILIRKTGRPLPPGEWIAARPVAPGEWFQGVQEDVLLPGWYPQGYSSADWAWRYAPATVIPPGHVGVMIRMFGDDLPEGQVLADENADDETRGIKRRGPMRKILQPGTYPINTIAYNIRIFPTRIIEPGEIGVLCKRYGRMPADRAAFLSETGERGVQKRGIAPGTYFVNPYAEDLRIVSRQSRKLDLAVSGRIRFPSNDGFEVALNGIIEWSLREQDIPLVYVKHGDVPDAGQKLLLPTARAKSLLRGSRKQAGEFIRGSTRQVFQDEFAGDLRSVVEPEGIIVHSVLISGIQPPDEIAKPIRDREISLLEREQYQKQMNTERGRVEYERQNGLQKRPSILAAVQSNNVRIITEARQAQEMGLIEAKNSFDIATFELNAAHQQVAIARAAGAADALWRKLHIERETRSIRGRIEALGGGVNFARNALIEHVAPHISSITGGSGSMAATLLKSLFQSEAVASAGAGGPTAGAQPQQ